MTAIEDRSYEHPLEDEPARTRKPVYVDAVVRQDERTPIVPAALRGANLATTVRRGAGRTVHRVKYHVAYSPLYLLMLAVYTPRGAGRALWSGIRWAADWEQHGERQRAADRDDVDAYLRLVHVADRHRRHRVPILLAVLAVVAAAAVAVWLYAPWWMQILAGVVVVAVLGRLGRPADRRIVRPAVVAPRYRVVNADVVIRAYEAAKLCDQAKEAQRLSFASPMARDGEGSRVAIDLPYGKGFRDAINAREGIASGLDVAVSQVFLTRDPTSNRRHILWVADRDPLAVPAGRTPLLRLRPTDVWRPAPFGLDERGRAVTVPLMWHSLLLGAQPRQGKSFSARALGLYAALDPHVKLTVFDGKGSPDWRKFSLVADRCGFGLAMSRDGDPVELLLDALHELKTDVQQRYEKLSSLPASICPEGKLTREIARDRQYGMPVRLVILDEFQEYFDLGEASKEIAALLVYLVKVAPAAGVSVIGATQRPSGIGSGQVAQQFTSFRDNFQVRFSLRTGSWQMSDLVLGAGAYSEGHDSSTLLPEYKGVGILRGASDVTPTVRTYLADGQDAEKILTAARSMREQAGTLTGMAAGEDMTRESRDPLADVIRVWSFIDRPALHWTRLAELLAERIPESYAAITGEALSALLREHGVPSVQVKDAGVNQRGCKREAVEVAIRRREIGSGGAATG